MKKIIDCTDRARRILIKDKLCFPDEFIALLTGDISNLLSHYFDLIDHFAKVKVSVNESGEYLILVEGRAVRIKDLPTCLPLLE